MQVARRPSPWAEEHSSNLVEEHWPAGPGLLRSLWMHRFVLLGALLVGLLVGLWGAGLRTIEYEARGDLLIDHSATSRLLDEPGRRINPERHLRNRAEQVQSRRVMEAAAELLGPPWSVGALYDVVTVSGAETLDAITITAAASTPEAAAAVVNAVGQAYIRVSMEDARARATDQILEIEAAIERVEERQRSISRRLDRDPANPVLLAQQDAAVRELIDLTSRVERLSVVEELPPSGVSSFEAALPPRRPSQPGPRQTAALGALAGLALGGAFAWWKAGQGVRVTDARTVAKVLGVPVLVTIPRERRRHATKGGDDRYRNVAVLVGQATREMALPIIGFVSARSGEGTTTTVHRTALAAKEEREVIVVDGDAATRTLTHRYRMAGEPGLTDVAWGLVPLSRARHLVSASRGRPFSLVPLGQSLDAAGGLTGRTTLTGIFKGGEDEGIVLVDCGAVLALSETVMLLGQTDATVVVVRHQARVNDLERLRERLGFSGSPVIGVIYTDARRRGGWGSRT